MARYWIDHVIVAVADFEAAANRLRDEFGLVALPGGEHPGGTRNWIVPLEPPQYLELLGVGDEAALGASAFGRWLLERLADGDGLASWAIGTDDIEAVAARTGRAPVEGWIVEDGQRTPGWRSIRAAGARAAYLPFFIEYEGDAEESQRRRRETYKRAASPSSPGAIVAVEQGGDAAELREWIGDAEIAVECIAGAPGIRAVRIATARGEIVVR